MRLYVYLINIEVVDIEKVIETNHNKNVKVRYRRYILIEKRVERR